MTKRRVIINADGYGFTPGVNRGVVESFQANLVRSTSCTPNFGFLTEASKVAKQFPAVSFGIHFNLSVGEPVSKPEIVPSLVNDQLRFHGNKLINKILRKELVFNEMVTELKSQAAQLADQGIKITHFDGHQNKHLYPMFFAAAIEVAKYFNIRAMRTHNRMLYLSDGPVPTMAKFRYYLTHPSRIVTHWGGYNRSRSANQRGFVLADRLITPGYIDTSHKTLQSFWTTLAHTLPQGVSEVYCHPGYPDDLLRQNAYYVDERELETKVLSDPALLEIFREAGVEVISFHELIQEH
jgi:predicted glycoside hydrolase/deacetylase ChbG (UPF0249 family)